MSMDAEHNEQIIQSLKNKLVTYISTGLAVMRSLIRS